jgi:hypothetical protein
MQRLAALLPSATAFTSTVTSLCGETVTVCSPKVFSGPLSLRTWPFGGARLSFLTISPTFSMCLSSRSRRGRRAVGVHHFLVEEGHAWDLGVKRGWESAGEDGGQAITPEEPVVVLPSRAEVMTTAGSRGTIPATNGASEQT